MESNHQGSSGRPCSFTTSLAWRQRETKFETIEKGAPGLGSVDLAHLLAVFELPEEARGLLQPDGGAFWPILLEDEHRRVAIGPGESASAMFLVVLVLADVHVAIGELGGALAVSPATLVIGFVDGAIRERGPCRAFDISRSSNRSSPSKGSKISETISTCGATPLAHCLLAALMAMSMYFSARVLPPRMSVTGKA